MIFHVAIAPTITMSNRHPSSELDTELNALTMLLEDKHLTPLPEFGDDVATGGFPDREPDSDADMMDIDEVSEDEQQWPAYLASVTSVDDIMSHAGHPHNAAPSTSTRQINAHSQSLRSLIADSAEDLPSLNVTFVNAKVLPNESSVPTGIELTFSVDPSGSRQSHAVSGVLGWPGPLDGNPGGSRPWAATAAFANANLSKATTQERAFLSDVLAGDLAAIHGSDDSTCANLQSDVVRSSGNWACTSDIQRESLSPEVNWAMNEDEEGLEDWVYTLKLVHHKSSS